MRRADSGGGEDGGVTTTDITCEEGGLVVGDACASLPPRGEDDSLKQKS